MDMIRKGGTFRQMKSDAISITEWAYYYNYRQKTHSKSEECAVGQNIRNGWGECTEDSSYPCST